MAMVIVRQSVLDGKAHLPQWIAQVSDVTASRATDTIYQNTTGRPVLCLASVTCTRGATPSGTTARAQAKVEGVTPPTVVVCTVGLDTASATFTEIEYFQLVFVVPPAHYYSVVEGKLGTGEVVLFNWIEVTL